MQDVLIKNKLLIQALEKYRKVILDDTPQEVRDGLKFQDLEGRTADYYCSKEYLELRQGYSIFETGFPRYSLGFDANSAGANISPPEWIDACKQLDNEVIQAIGVGFSALKMYYPTDGFIDWHNNANCPGQNLLLSYSEGGNGYFEWQDPVTKEIHRMNDRPGWTAKVGYYGSDKEPDKVIWHCARTYEPRLTVSYVVRDQAMWEYMVEDIQSDQ